MLANTPGPGASLLNERAQKDLSMTARAHQELERQIVSGEIRGGSKLKECELAKSFGVSRGPVREAFRALDQAGLVRFEKNRGVFVRQVSLEEASDISEVRASLEGLIGRLAARRIDAEQVRQLRSLVANMALLHASLDEAAYFALNIEFHALLARMSRNAALVATYKRTINELDLFRRQTLALDTSNITLSTAEHLAIVNAVAARDEDLAAELMTAHALQSCRRLHAAIARNGAANAADNAVRQP